MIYAENTTTFVTGHHLPYVCCDDEFRDGARFLRRVGKLNFPALSNEVSGLDCSCPALGRREERRKERVWMLFEMTGH